MLLWQDCIKNLAQVIISQVDINHASEIDEIFDDISYKKGASVIRMLQSYLGAESFQVRLLHFLIFFQFLFSYTKYAVSLFVHIHIP